MPTILRVDGFRFYFYSHEPNEPPHVHIDKDAATAKVWLLDILPALKDLSLPTSPPFLETIQPSRHPGLELL